MNDFSFHKELKGIHVFFLSYFFNKETNIDYWNDIDIDMFNFIEYMALFRKSAKNSCKKRYELFALKSILFIISQAAPPT